MTMRRTRRPRTRTPLETRNPGHKSAFSFPPENEMTGLGLFSSSSSSSSSASSSSSTSSNLSPLALPFTVERSNPKKFNLGSNFDSHFNFHGKSDGAASFWSTSPNFQSSTTTQGLLADSIRTATVPNPNPNPNPNAAPGTHNRSSVSAVNLSANQRVIDASFSSPFNASTTHNWSSMNSSVTSGLEPINTPAGHLFGLNPNTQPNKWSLGSSQAGYSHHDVGDSVMPLNFSLLPGRSFSQDYGSSQVSYSQSLSGSKYSGQADGSRGKEDSSLFGGSVTRENSIGPSVFGKSHVTSPSPTCHGHVSSGFSNEHTFTWNGSTSRYPFETRSIFYDSSSDQLSPSMTTKSLDISSTSPFNKNKNNLLLSHNPLKEESYQVVGFEHKSNLNSQLPEINSTDEVNSAANSSEHLDHHNPGEDSPCWKGAPTHLSSSGSQGQESSQHPMKKLQKNSDEDDLYRTFHVYVENAANVVTSGIDVKMVVEALNNLSESLLRLCSKDECSLKEQDHKALDQVIAKLNVCMSSKSQQVDPALECSSAQQVTSDVLNEERKNDPFGKNIEESQSAYVSDEGLQKDCNMVQKIKRVFDENLELKEEFPSDPLLYKNLWLEAEAELCVSSYRTRLHRAKREMSKLKALDSSQVPCYIKNISSSYISPTAPKPLHEAAGSKTSKTHAPNISMPIVDDDVENSVMARFNILKHREISNSVNMAEKEPTDVNASGYKVQSSRVVEEPHSQHLLDTDDVVVMRSHGNQNMHGPLAKEDVEHAVMARLNILKSRGGLDRVDVEQGVSVDGGHAQVSENGVGTSTMQNPYGSFYNASSFGWEYVLDG